MTEERIVIILSAWGGLGKQTCIGANLKLFGLGQSLSVLCLVLPTEVAVLLSSPVVWGDQQTLVLHYIHYIQSRVTV